ncbi:MAG TPA: S46 family peptidase [Vicinamibacteria bacterium]|nr:S46 family peptidase [Vicinamibacteria bacterium]
MASCRAVLVLWALALAAPLLADEGFWTFENPPLDRLREAGLSTSPEGLERMRRSSLRFMDGGSGAFVSKDGLMATNHHVALECLQNMSTKDVDLLTTGFVAPSRDKEPACPGYEVNALVRTEDVTARVQQAVTSAMSDKEAADARKAASARLRSECAATSGLRCDMVSLYQGGEYHLYAYKTYTDVRLVFAPEQEIAFFGGDPDNYTYPRHDFDVCFFRAYENGRPAVPPAFLPWSKKGIADGDPVLVPGNPARSARQNTLAQLVSEREVLLPSVLKYVSQRLRAIGAYSARGPEQTRRGLSDTFELENSRKAFEGRLLALYDAKGMAKKADDEKTLRAQVAADPALASAIGDPWGQVSAALQKSDPRVDERRFVSFGGSVLFTKAGQIVRLTAEVAKPNEKRLEEFEDSALPSLKNELFSAAPIYADLEEALLADQFAQAREALGASHPFVQAVLEGKTPEEAAHALVTGTRLQDVKVREGLVKGGTKAVLASTDPLIVLARKVDPLAREARRFRDEEVRAPTTRAEEKIAEARFKVHGRSAYPDATFSLRLSYGTVKGYPAEGTRVAPFTTFHGLFDRSLSFGGKAPWNLPARWLEKKGALDLSVPLNFVCTADIIGGSSGSPVLDKEGEVVGLVFDGNIESMAWDYFYTDEQARAVALDSRAVLEGLRHLFDAQELVKELVGP